MKTEVYHLANYDSLASNTEKTDMMIGELNIVASRNGIVETVVMLKAKANVLTMILSKAIENISTITMDLAVIAIIAILKGL